MCAICLGTRDCIKRDAFRHQGSVGSHSPRNADAALEQTFAQPGNPKLQFKGCTAVPNKDLTIVSPACANISSQFVVPMARKHQRGFWDRGTEIRGSVQVRLLPLSIGLRTLSCA